MNKAVSRTALAPTLLAGGFILLDLILDRYLGGFAVGWTHLILVVSVLLISYILMSRAVDARKRAEAVLRQARDEMESQVRERTAELEQANQALRTSEETARALMNASSDPRCCWMPRATSSPLMRRPLRDWASRSNACWAPRCSASFRRR